MSDRVRQDSQICFRAVNSSLFPESRCNAVNIFKKLVLVVVVVVMVVTSMTLLLMILKVLHVCSRKDRAPDLTKKKTEGRVDKERWTDVTTSSPRAPSPRSLWWLGKDCRRGRGGSVA